MMFTPEEYRQKVCSLVRELRINPFDEVTRLILADLIDEFGAAGAHDRTTRYLRAESMVLGTIDARAWEMLDRFISGADILTKRRYADDLPFQDGRRRSRVGEILTLEQYDALWWLSCDLLYESSQVFVFCDQMPELADEVITVRQARQARGQVFPPRLPG